MALGAECQDRRDFGIGIVGESQHILRRLHALGENIGGDGLARFLFKQSREIASVQPYQLGQGIRADGLIEMVVDIIHAENDRL